MPDAAELVTVGRMSGHAGRLAGMRKRVQSPLLRDLGLIVAAVGSLLVGLAVSATNLGHGLGVADVVGAVIAVALVLLARRALLVALAIGAVATAITMAVTGQPAVVFTAVVFLLYKVASQTDRRTTGIAWGATVGFVYSVSIPALGGVNLDRDLDIAIWSLLAVAVGEAVRSRRAYLAALEERARLRVVEERMRIARELHDLVAHRMAVINLQAGVASHVLRSRPEEAERALLIVRGSASEVLGELGEMLSVLRNVDDPQAPVQPAPTLRDLGALVESFASAGLDVSWKSSGALEGVPDSVQLALFRLAQEGLTNAQRYGDGRASLRVERSTSAVNVTVANRIAAEASPAAGYASGNGYGLLGMRERVAAVGGTVEIGPTADGWFRVAAHIPTPGRGPG
jgi:signal transduction histidine kinase